jgi:hypothetical protein
MDARTLALAAVLALPFAAAGSGDGEIDRATLRGLKAVNLVVDAPHEELAHQGITQANLRSEVEGRLQTAGVRIEPNAVEFLGVHITPVRGARGPYTLYITVGLYQPVLLARDKTTRTVTQTWEGSTLFVAEPKAMFRSTMDAVGQLAKQFATAYRAANPP